MTFIIKKNIFYYLSSLISIVNCIVLCLDRYPMSEDDIFTMNLIDFIGTVFLAIEVIFLVINI